MSLILHNHRLTLPDQESYIYRFSWDKEDLLSYHWKEHYVKQPEVLAYLNHVVDKYDLRKYMQLNTELLSADWDDLKHAWRIEVSTGETFTARYLVTALGLLSKQNYPDINGIDRYKGEMYHTAKWPQGFDFTGKCAGVIGCGSTGIQVITDIVKRVRSLTCFQRHPQYSVPSGDGPVSPEYREYVNHHYDEMFDQVRNSITAFGFKESTIPAMSVSPEERERIFQENWDKGNGFRFMFGTFCDITYNKEANEAACDFIRRKDRADCPGPGKGREADPA
jgi:cyclohexanone monooxygenase